MEFRNMLQNESNSFHDWSQFLIENSFNDFVLFIALRFGWYELVI